MPRKITTCSFFSGQSFWQIRCNVVLFMDLECVVVFNNDFGIFNEGNEETKRIFFHFFSQILISEHNFSIKSKYELICRPWNLVWLFTCWRGMVNWNRSCGFALYFCTLFFMLVSHFINYIYFQQSSQPFFENCSRYMSFKFWTHYAYNPML